MRIRDRDLKFITTEKVKEHSEETSKLVKKHF